jgi:hypothetical protein
MKHFGQHLVAALAALSSIATLVSLFYEKIPQMCPLLKVLMIFAIVAIAVFYASCQVKKKKKIFLSLNNDFKLTIEEGDIFNQKGIIVIPVNEYFDTHVGDGVISPKTIHGIFITRFFSSQERIDELDYKIQRSLKDYIPLDSGCKRKFAGSKDKKYKLGTCATVEDGENKYVLCALSHFDSDDKAYLDRSEFQEVIVSLMEYLSSICEGNNVYMPLLGTGLSRLQRSSQRVLTYVIDTLDFSVKSCIPSGIHMEIKSLYSAKIDLNAIDDLYNSAIKDV